METKIIKTEAENAKAISEIEKLMSGSKLSRQEEDGLELLYLLVDNFESKAYPIPDPDPIETINFFMDTCGFTRTDLIKELGDKSKASQILNRRRALSLAMIRNLAQNRHIPADILPTPYKLKNRNSKKQSDSHRHAVANA